MSRPRVQPEESAVAPVPVGGRRRPSEAPSRAGAHWRLGRACENLGDIEAAIEHYRATVQLRPDFEQAQSDLERLTRG